MIGSIIACDHAERRGNCMLRTSGSFAALLQPDPIERAARRIAQAAGARWPQDAGRYRRFAKAALESEADDA